MNKYLIDLCNLCSIFNIRTTDVRIEKKKNTSQSHSFIHCYWGSILFRWNLYRSLDWSHVKDILDVADEHNLCVFMVKCVDDKQKTECNQRIHLMSIVQWGGVTLQLRPLALDMFCLLNTNGLNYDWILFSETSITVPLNIVSLHGCTLPSSFSIFDFIFIMFDTFDK